MVNNNNLIPKENIYKTEEVREIKNEIPSYEEFLKTYEANHEVNDSYENEIESYSNIETPKGYGPCCVCYKDTYWMDLRMSCPAAGCDNKEPIYFTHSPGCESRLEVSNKARIRCSGCSFNCDLKDYHFACSRHRGDYRTMNRDSWYKTMSIMLMSSSLSQVVSDLSVYMVNHGW